MFFFTLVLWIMHILNKPNMLSVNEQLIPLWYYQLWFFQGIFTILIIADTFYFLIKDKKWLIYQFTEPNQMKEKIFM